MNLRRLLVNSRYLLVSLRRLLVKSKKDSSPVSGSCFFVLSS
ncbi:hypothetical protein ACFQ9Y_04290 [Peribacillus simplex]